MPSSINLPCLFHGEENDKNVHGDEHGEALCVGLWQVQLLWKNLCASSIVMVEPAQDREGEDLPACGIWWPWLSWWLRNLLDALMRPGLVEVVHKRAQHPVELLLMEDKQMIEAFPSHAAQEAFTDGIGSWSVIGGFENLNVTGFRNPRKAHPKLAIIIPDEVLRSHAKGGGFP